MKNTLISSITRGKESCPPRIFLYGQEGVGKSTFGGSAPNPIFIQTEDGLSEIEASKFPLAESYEEALRYLEAIRDGEHEFQTLVIDSLDWLERLRGEVDRKGRRRIRERVHLRTWVLARGC